MKKLNEKLRAKLSKSGGFTLVEMLIVVAIIAILIAVSIPLIGSSLDKARQAVDSANERSASGLATIYYLTSEDENDNFTTGVTKYYVVDGNSKQGTLVDVDDKPTTGYGQMKTHKDQVIKVVIKTPTDTDNGVTISWDDTK